MLKVGLFALCCSEGLNIVSTRDRFGLMYDVLLKPSGCFLYLSLLFSDSIIVQLLK